MKTLVNILLVFAAILTFGGNVNAQSQRLAYFDSDIILENIPEYKGIEQELNLLSDQWKEEIERQSKEIKELRRDFEAKEILYTEEIKTQKQNEIKTLEKARETYMAQKFGPNGDYFKRSDELLEPLQRQIFAAVRIVAERQNFDYVFDRAGDIYMVYAKNDWNLNEDILLEMGIDIDDIKN